MIMLKFMFDLIKKKRINRRDQFKHLLLGE